ncbi:MAG: hypothetical protein ACREIJ_11430 [Nitrospiraceae bacterium]
MLRHWSAWLNILFGIFIVSTYSGCLSPIAIHRTVIEYDRTVSYVEAHLLLLNIARAAPSAGPFHRGLQRGRYCGPVEVVPNDSDGSHKVPDAGDYHCQVDPGLV